MPALHILLTSGLAAAVACLAGSAGAETIRVLPGNDVQSVLDRTVAGDEVVLTAGVHRGPVTLARTVTLSGEAGAVVEAEGRGSVITVEGADAVVRGLIVRGSGMDLAAMDAGVFVAKTAARAVVEDNRLEGNLYGVYLHGAPAAEARRNVILGIREGRINEAGNGVSVWNAPGAKVLDNDIRFGRDGIFSVTSRDNVYRGNRFRDVRFAIHYMYTNNSEISDNVSTENAVGFAIMYSNNLKITGNRSIGDRDHGFLFNYANGSVIQNNQVSGHLYPASRWATAGRREKADAEHGVALAEPTADGSGSRPAPGKCVFIYNANKNRFTGNRFSGCEIGIHFTAGSEGNEIVGNVFEGNRNQVKYVGTRYLDWSRNGRGNYWSDNPAFDLNGDGVGDSPYRPNDLIDRVLWTSPEAKVLTNSPAVQVIRWAQSQFPAILPGGVVDRFPLMSPPTGVPRAQDRRP
jgi:nitrous oxidase accessory protein